ncbi:phosphotransferase family protein [Cytobacillus sp. FJAT-54145]|uniref:Phosphotransferase family protein n=1 Tax=Cytobacillus spartinae TaxID=3299023 RepID=A0ABW6KBF8_9BACI
MTIQLNEIPQLFQERIGKIHHAWSPKQGWTSNVVVLESNNGRYVIKRANHPRYKHWLKNEAEILQALEETALPTPKFYDSYITENETWVLMSYIEGIPLRQAIAETEHREKLIVEFGKIARALHRSPVPKIFDQNVNWLSVQLHKAEVDHLKYGSDDGSPELLETLKNNRPNPVAQTLIHGDFTVDNVLVNGDKIVGIIDWSGGAFGDPRYDLALAIRPKEVIFENETDKQIFFKAYGADPITEDEFLYFEEGLYSFF